MEKMIFINYPVGLCHHHWVHWHMNHTLFLKKHTFLHKDFQRKIPETRWQNHTDNPLLFGVICVSNQCCSQYLILFFLLYSAWLTYFTMTGTCMKAVFFVQQLQKRLATEGINWNGLKKPLSISISYLSLIFGEKLPKDFQINDKVVTYYHAIENKEQE